MSVPEAETGEQRRSKVEDIIGQLLLELANPRLPVCVVVSALLVVSTARNIKSS